MNIKEIVKSNLCIGCGLCSAEAETKGMKYSSRNGCFIPQNVQVANDSIANKICPGKGYNIVQDGRRLFGAESNSDLYLGFYKSLFALRTTNNDLIENASSGGFISTLLLFLLEEKFVDKVVVTQFECSESGVKTKTFLTSDRNEIIAAQGSKYCPVNFDNLVNDLKRFDGKVALVATPCVIAGIRSIQRLNPELFKSNITYTIANFCGGFKTYNNIERLSQIHKISYSNIKEFRFRGGGQPGSLRFVAKSGEIAETPYPKYVGMTGESKMLRCHLCVDATGELADISCGDAWIPCFEKDQYAWSVIICRTSNANDLVKKMIDTNKVISSQINNEEVRYSQRFNLRSKKTRQFTRMKVYKTLGYKIPFFDGGYTTKSSGLKTELIVFFTHQFKLFLEKTGLYYPLYGYKKMQK